MMYNLIYSPLEQFEVTILLPLNVFGLDVSLTNATLCLFFAFFFYYLVLKRGLTVVYILPTVFQRLAELMFLFVYYIVKQQSGIKGLNFFPVIFALFYFILFLNLLGLTPFGFTVTSQIACTFLLGFSIFLGVVFIALAVLKKDFIKLFIPATTGPIVPLLIGIEIFSYCIRPISLSVRLFANMLAGHTLLHILAGFGVSLLKVDFFIGIFMFLPIIAICALELGIAFLQAYVFVVLVCIYLKESFYGH